jgi:hypothetical protein
MDQKDEKLIQNKVLATIKSGDVTMRPKWQFFLRTGLEIAGVIILLLVLIYLASFIIFILQRTGLEFVPSFGWHGLVVFLMSAPWILFILCIVFIIILETLVHQYSFAYKRPIIYSVLGIVLATVFAGFIVSRTSMHRQLLQSANSHQLPVAGPLYRGFGEMRPKDVHKGIIIRQEASGFDMQTMRHEVVFVMVTPRTRIFRDGSLIQGDYVVVLGMLQDGTIQAVGIRKIEFEDF